MYCLGHKNISVFVQIQLLKCTCYLLMVLWERQMHWLKWKQQERATILLLKNKYMKCKPIASTFMSFVFICAVAIFMCCFCRTIPQEDHLDRPGTSVVFLVKNKGKLLGLSLISCKDIIRYGIRGKRCTSPQLQRKMDVNKNRIIPLINHVIDDSQALKELKFRATQSRDIEAKRIVKIFAVTENK